MRNIVEIFSAVVILLLTGCASVPMGSLDQDARAKEFLPAPNMASLYIYRNEIFLEEFPITVSVNGKTLGQTAAHTYFHLNVMPGKYNIESLAQNVSSLPLSVEAGKNYFVWQEVKMGIGLWSAGSLLQQVDENTGRAGVMESKLITSSVLDKDLTPLGVTPDLPPPSPVPSSDTVSQKLRNLQELRKDGVITEDEFQKKKQQLLEKF